MTSTRALRALIVDDELEVRHRLTEALTREGFECQTANDGRQALHKIKFADVPFDLVVTDLILPLRNGHSLIVDLLEPPVRPAIVVLTSIAEPRLTKDLMARGVDDLVFKPVEYRSLAAKLRVVTDRRFRAIADATTGRMSGARLPCDDGQDGPVTEEEFQSRLRSLSRMPSVSQAGFEVFKLTVDPDADVAKVAAAVQLDPALVTEVVRLANSSFFNPSNGKIAGVEQAVVRLGQKRVGEMALTTAALASITEETVPFFSLEQVWLKCLAGGICLELLLDRAKDVGPVDGLFCAAVLQPMSRVMLASLFPERYERMLKQSQSNRKSLWELESRIFPRGVGDAASDILGAWGFPEVVYRPLRHSAQPFHLLLGLNEPQRRRVELLKTANVLGELAAGRWESWDLVDLPSELVLKRLGVDSVTPLISQCRKDLALLSNYPLRRTAVKSKRSVQEPKLERQLLYKALSPSSVDLLPHLLAANKILLSPVDSELADIEETFLVNTQNVTLQHVVAQLRVPRNSDAIIVAQNDHAARLGEYGQVIGLPCSYGAITEACERASQASATDAHWHVETPTQVNILTGR